MKIKGFKIIIKKGRDNYLISNVVGLPGCHTQAKSFKELIKRTEKAISLHLKCQKTDKKFINQILNSLEDIKAGRIKRVL